MKTLIVINNESFGKGDDELGKRLMGAYLKKLWVRDEMPDTIVCYNSGAKLVAKGSMVLDALNGLYEKGVDILACGTCLNHYHLADQVKVGRSTDMGEIVELMMTYDKVITV
ncbi:sulfurtransferase-like selenium metabolism protein YedF [Vallitalea okinawensis]|uniref:sulfurtransferase-like selenium metabolism protein YedF n=1 Tax=Vallitalea okinawensis TaxID=2078660 RepID=UPI000CFA83DB|nr:sulfurtransferase-like selenium metabolism protein YedF [Vallitalea okinawensis]